MKKKIFYLKLMFLTLMSVQMNAQVILDQHYEGANSETPINDDGSPIEAVFQTFTASESGKLIKLELGLKTLTGTATISIMATNGNGEPTGSDLVSRTVSSVGEIATVNFPSPITITAGTKYAIKIVKTTEYRIKNEGSNDYNQGGFYIKPRFEAIYAVENDMNFKTYVDLQLQDNATLTNFTSCAEMANGSIALAPTGGVAPYIYTWTSTVPGFTNPGNVNNISGLLPGSYTCNIKDSRTTVSRDKTYTYYIEDRNPIKLDAYVTNNSPACGNHSVTISPLASIIYKNSFETSDGITLSGDAVRESFNQIKLTPDENNKNGKVIINNLPATLPSNFEVNWRFFHKQKDGADGYSFNLGNDSFPGAFEDGTNQGLAVKFKIYQQDQVSIKWNGAEIVAPVNTTLELGKWIDAKLTVVAGKVTLYVNGQRIANNVTITGFTQNNAYKIIFAARTGGASNESIIDDVTFGDFSAFEYSIDGTTYQTSNVFSNITLPADRVVPIWLKQNGCSRKFTDYIYPVNGDISQLNITSNSNCNQGTISISDVFDPSTAPVNRTFIFGATIGNKAGYNIHKGTTEIIGSGFLLTKDAQDNKGYYSFSKPEGFSKNFELNVVHSSLNKSGAEGFSINLGNLSALENETVNYENGVSSGLAIRFKTNNTDNVSMFYNNVQIGTTVSPGDLETGGANNIKIEVKGTTIKTYLNETEILTGTLPASYTTDDFANYKFAIAARTSGASNENLIQNVQLFSLEQLQYSKDNVTFTDLTTSGVTTQTEIPFVSSDIVNNKVKIYFKFKNGCKLTNPYELTVFKSAAAPAGSSTQYYTEGTTKFQDLTITTDPGYVLRWYDSPAGALTGTFASGIASTELIQYPSSFIVYAVAFPIGNTTCRSPYTEVTLTTITPSIIVLTQIGNEGDDPNTVTSVVTVAQLGQIEPAITGIVAANQAAYQAYIDANPNLFSSPLATPAEVQAMVTAVNATLSTDSFDATTKLVVYPNPSNGMFTIEMDQNATIELYDVVGKQLKTQKITVGTSQLDLTDYNSGMYFAKVTNELNQTKTVRLIKQ